MRREVRGASAMGGVAVLWWGMMAVGGVGAAEEVARWRGMAGAGPVLSVKSVEASGEKPGETSEEKPGEISKEISEDISEEISEEISAGLAWGVDLGGPAVLPG